MLKIVETLLEFSLSFFLSLSLTHTPIHKVLLSLSPLSSLSSFLLQSTSCSPPVLLILFSHIFGTCVFAGKKSEALTKKGLKVLLEGSQEVPSCLLFVCAAHA